MTRRLTSSGKSSGEPAAAAPDHAVGLEHAAVVERDRVAGGRRAGADERARRAPAPARASVCTAFWARSTPASGSCSDPGEVVALEAGEARGGDLDVLALGGDAELAQHAAATRPPSRPSPCANQLTPALASAASSPDSASSSRHSVRARRALRRVVGVGAVRAADQPRLAARGRAHVAGLELVHQHDLVAPPRQPPGQRRPERPAAHDHDHAAPHVLKGPGTFILRPGAKGVRPLYVGRRARRRPRQPRHRPLRRRGGRSWPTRVGDPDAAVHVLVVGDVHGNEPAGEAIVARLRRRAAERRGVLARAHREPRRPRADTRQNARGVDLNRNFPWRWAAGARGTYYPGPRAASEPETQALMRLVQPRAPAAGDLLPPAHGDHGPGARRRPGGAARSTRAAPGCRCARCPTTTAPRSAGRTTCCRDGSAFVVELRAGPADVPRNAGAVLALARRYRAQAVRIVLVRHGQTEWSASGQAHVGDRHPAHRRRPRGGRAQAGRAAGRARVRARAHLAALAGARDRAAGRADAAEVDD